MIDMVFVKAQVGPPNVGDPKNQFTVQYFDEHGNMTIRSGGTRAWRCNNPGNLLRSRYSMSAKRRAIGFAGDTQDEYAVYPDKETGREALVLMLKGSIYSPKTLRAAMEYYEPKNKGYIDIITKRTGIDPNKTINSLNEKEFCAFLSSIEFVEGWIVGREDFIEKWIISGVHKKRGSIYEYFVQRPQGNAWIKKDEALLLTNNGKLHAVVVHLKNGNAYLRPEHGTQPFERVT